MDGIRGEVSNKIRSAIKAKLMELGAYVDDELPDYIMVMVANKRSRQQMEDDLQLFLGDSTSTFTSWLHTVLSKLQQVTVNSTEIKKGSEKKRISTEDHKKEKRKKLKKEKPDTPEKSPEKVKSKEKGLEEKVLEEKGMNLTTPQARSNIIKPEPIDLITDEVSLLHEGTLKINQPAAENLPGSQHRKSLDSKANEDDDEDDFINLKADAEADMWGDAEDTATSAVRSSNITPISSQPNSTAKSGESNGQETQSEHLKQPKVALDRTTSVKMTAAATSNMAAATASKTAAVEPKPAPRIIRISETLRDEQETLKPSSKATSDPQALVKRVFQSHIVSQRNVRDKDDKSRGRNSSLTTSDNHTRRSDHRGNRKHEQPDLRETLRKERQREREHNRSRQRDRRRSSERSRAQNSTSGARVSSQRDENEPDPALASVVRVKPRPQIPAALQANRSLILKAVAEAQKSVSKVVIRPEQHSLKQQPLKRSVKDRLQARKQPSVKTSPSKVGQLNSNQVGRLPSRDTLKKMSFTVLAKDATPSEEPLAAEYGDVSDEGSLILDPSLNILVQVPASPVAGETRGPSDPIQTEKVRRWIKDVEEATKSETAEADINTDTAKYTTVESDAFPGLDAASKQDDEDSEVFDDALEIDSTSLKTSDIHSVVISEDQPLKQSSGTQFVVTLDGLDPMLLRSFALETDHQVERAIKPQIQRTQDLEDEEGASREELKEQLLRQELLRQQAAARENKTVHHSTNAVPPVTASVNPAVKRSASPSLETRPLKVLSAVSKSVPSERCKFWPTCKNGDKCEFHHPNVTCKSFPNCKFADRCLYIHPTCRFNTACTRSDCPYTHTGPRPTHTTPPVGVHSGGPTIKQACKYFPNCSNLSCPYIHPTVCKFGTHCTKPKCQFIHSDKGLVSKHKWVRH